MNCPSCSTTLLMADKNGVEIDYCPKCRGIWLDRGELEKIMERESSYSAPTRRLDDDHYKDDYKDDHHRGGYRKDDHYKEDRYKDSHYGKKKGGFLSDLFDF